MIRIDDLDEWQGLTADDVAPLMSRLGWTRTSGGWSQEIDALTVLISHWKDAFSYTDASRQALLREMNPRMRPGLPSLAAQEAHSRNGGVWIACHGELGNGGSIVFLSFDPDCRDVAIWDGEGWNNAESEMVADMPNWRFWPCDANGNKVRYPTNEQGEML